MPAFRKNVSHFKDRAVETDLDFIDKIGEKHFYSRDPSLPLHLSIFFSYHTKGCCKHPACCYLDANDSQ